MKRATVLGLAGAVGALLLVTLVAKLGAHHVSTLIMRRVTILSPVPGPNTQTTGYWNGLPENYKFNPYVDEEHTDDWISENPWSGNGQYGMFMNINDATINSFGCGPDGPIACKVGTTPAEHWARNPSLRFAGGQKMMVGSFPTPAMPGLDPEAGRGPDGKQPSGYGNQGAQQPGSFYNSQESKQQQLMVGSYPIYPKPGQKEPPHQPAGYGNQAAEQGAGFYNQKDRKTQSLMVGSYPVPPPQPWEVDPPHPPQGYGNQAARSFTNRMGMSKQQSLMVGSYPIHPKPWEKEPPHQPAGYGNQAAQQGAGFFNQKSRGTQSLMVGSYPIYPKPGQKEPPHQPAGYGNQAAEQGAGFYNQ